MNGRARVTLAGLLVVLVAELLGCGRKAKEDTIVLAAMRGDTAAVRSFLDKGADPNAKGPGGTSPLLLALFGQHEETAVALLDGGAAPNVPGRSTVAPLYFAVRARMRGATESLIRHGADLNVADPQGATPLAVALMLDYDDLADLLKAHGAVAAWGASANRELMRACSIGRTRLMAAILDAGADPDGVSEAGTTPLLAAVAARRTEAVRLLLLRGAKPDAAQLPEYIPLCRAVETDAKELAEVLVEHDADVNARDKDGFALLSVAQSRRNAPIEALLAAHGGKASWEEAPNGPFFDAALRGDAESLTRLLAEGVHPDVRGPCGATALHLAVAADRPDAVALLLEAHASPNMFRTDGVTPLHLAATAGNLRAAQMLVAHKADPAAADSKGNTPLSIALAAGLMDMVRLLDEAVDTDTSRTFDLADPTWAPAEGVFKATP